MTFIASVVAKKGVVIIADSLVTTSRNVIEFEDFYKLIQKTPTTKTGKLARVDIKELTPLFKTKPSYTKDFQDKIFKYNFNTAISIAGSAVINKKNVETIISEAIKSLNPSASSNKKTIDVKVNDFKDFVVNEVKTCVSNGGYSGQTVFVFTHYAKQESRTRIFKVYINKTFKKDLSNPAFEIAKVMEMPKEYTVVCEGQNRISEKILFGDIETISYIIPNIAEKIFKDFKIKKQAIPTDYITNLIQDRSILTDQFFEDIKMKKLTELSLQQAYDLASLLMKIERDVQKFTENIPTVGGVVKTAVIDQKGFKFIGGDGIVLNEKIHY